MISRTRNPWHDYLLALVSLLPIAGCGNLPSLENRTISFSVPTTEETQLGKAVGRLAKDHPEQSGIFPLANAHDAFAARVLLARKAERSLDVQYYIWRPDSTGMMLFKALYEAGERGVRVRLLLDDNNTTGLDPYLIALDAHPNIEVRLFNPFVYRNMRLLDYLTDFSRLNRRMHNKSFTADSQVTVIGGRNVGDEYFGAGDGMLFSDLDVMAAGPVSSTVSKDFDRYWASQSAYPLDRLLKSATREDMVKFFVKIRDIENRPETKSYIDSIRHSSFVTDLIEGNLPLEWAKIRLISDDPAKGLGQAKPEETLLYRLRHTLDEPSQSLYLVSPYLVLGKEGVEAFSTMSKEGVKICILTNSMESTDVLAVHSGYAKRRRSLLEAGIQLYESKSSQGSMPKSKDNESAGSSYSSLHAKTFSIDGRHIFIGSFNFDRRSVELNTEMGFIILSPALAGQIGNAFETQIPRTAYYVKLDGDKLLWLENRNGKIVRHEQEPGTSLWQRFYVWFLSLLPIEWLL